MVSRSLPAGIGAVGSAKARFFHPSDKIRAKWPNDNKRQLVNVLVIEKEPVVLYCAHPRDG